MVCHLTCSSVPVYDLRKVADRVEDVIGNIETFDLLDAECELTQHSTVMLAYTVSMLGERSTRLSGARDIYLNYRWAGLLSLGITK